MGFLLAILIIAAVFYMAYCRYRIKRAHLLAGTVYTKSAKIGNKSKPRINLLAIGDSIGTGVGASCFEKSVIGRVAIYLGKNNYVVLKNLSVNGSKIAALLKIEPQKRQDLTLILVSSNDVMRFTNFAAFKGSAERLLEKYSNISKKVIIIGPANVGQSSLLPLPLRIAYLCRGPVYASILEGASKKFKNIKYINSLRPKAKLGKYLKGYYSKDHLHPNDMGHEFWFLMIREEL